MRNKLAILLGASVLFSQIAHASLLMKPTYHPDLDYKAPILEGNYTDAVTHPDDILGFEVGFRVATPAKITEAVETWKGQSDRLKVVEYARSHENRPLFAIFISTPENLAKLDDIQQDLSALADPRSTSDAQAEQIIERLPAIAWMAYSIHGNETSGADAALAAIYHLAADQSQATTDLLDDMIVVIDPLMNPDGRDRFAKSLEQYRGTAPNVDDQALLHRGDWPYGRTNHYYFDLNRDFFYLTQPETKGRVALINKWRPQLMIDGHEMGPQDTYLMGPPRQPINAHIASSVQKWAVTFAQDQGAAFDDKGWRYYTGEWFENWYPGYSSYAQHRGTMHILYEQSRMAEDGVKRPEGTIQTYKESVHHQYISTIANLESLDKYSDEMYQDYWQDRKMVLSNKSPYANKTYVVLANENASRTHLLAEKLLAQDIEVKVATQAIEVDDAVNHLGQTLDETTIEAGSLIINNRQPEARLISAIMEFEAALKPEVLQKERARVLREGRSIMYDTSAWNLTMMYGLEALTVPDEITRNVSDYAPPSPTQNTIDKEAIAWFVDGVDDGSVAFAARLMEQGVYVRVIDKAAQFNDVTLNRGSVAVTITDNLNNEQLHTLIKQTADELNLRVQSATTGLGNGELPDWGGDHFVLLQQPQIAIATQAGTNQNDAGTVWWSIDSNLGIRHSHVDASSLASADLRRYNTIVMPQRRSLSEANQKALMTWVKQGGTLITHEGASAMMSKADDFSSVKLVDDIFEDAHDFDIALQRRLLAQKDYNVTDALNASLLSTTVSYPWDDKPDPLDKDELEKRNDWQKLFMPAGAMVAGHADQKHWLTFGVNERLPLLYRDQDVLVVPQGAESVVSVGIYQANPDATYEEAVGWYSIPNGQEVHVRMSGLVWPEASQRIANSSYLTRESIGKGQLIMFSGQPNFRGASRGTNRLLLNAIVYGAGFGTRPNINL
ncbi:peptidase [Glaciecola sp. XM2]|uniref:M14 family metallopeptidase n=1 Tax=Glaciecola sp. XM2 TaxID=1914931 RepID=UPI001BDE86C0|nr:M14 family metallopeptidase [Glaciecola sp. XM2]MBT1449773.1 peptidase [Glaciecola sp. XM2]